MACTAPLAQLLSQTYFMPFALTSNAIVARIFAVISDMLPSIERVWSLMAVAVARAPPVSSPAPESAAILKDALPALSAPLATVYDAAVQQLQNISPFCNNFSKHVALDFSTDLACDFHTNSRDNAAILSSNLVCFLENNDVCCGTSAQDDLGIPIGSAKKSFESKVLRRQKRPLNPQSIITPATQSFKKMRGIVNAEFCVTPSSSVGPDTFKEPRKVPSNAVDDMYSALCGSKSSKSYVCDGGCSAVFCFQAETQKMRCAQECACAYPWLHVHTIRQLSRQPVQFHQYWGATRTLPILTFQFLTRSANPPSLKW